MNNVLDDSLAVSSAQTAARKGLGLETTTNQRSVSSVLTRTSGINPQQIADAGQKVRFPQCQRSSVHVLSVSHVAEHHKSMALFSLQMLYIAAFLTSTASAMLYTQQDCSPLYVVFLVQQCLI